ncbi:hypothetical protein [Pectinatus frisingensis]|uniref:hypothetical protein n=1 Tax=Pectinatus frisingensis TaxID=865 RepID=UPI0018C6D2E7|nr:hypothetical protein [Pectinatus frisingensis]
MPKEYWTKEQTEYLVDHWGERSLPAIAKYLKKSINAVTLKRQRLGLGSLLHSGGYVTWNELIKAVTGNETGNSYKDKSWIQSREFPIHYKQVKENRFKVVYLEEFWKWAEKNQSFIDFSKMEKGILGAEPGWVKEKRRSDMAAQRYKKTPWTPEEDARLVMLLKQYKYGYAELSKMLGRTAGAVQRRVCDLGLKERPVRRSAHEKWEAYQIEQLHSLIEASMPYPLVAERIGKSEKAIRGYVWRIYGTESQDRVRNMMLEAKKGQAV